MPIEIFIQNFLPLENLRKEFYVKNSNGEPFKKIKSIEGVINNNTLFTAIDNTGKMICFDLNGN